MDIPNIVAQLGVAGVVLVIWWLDNRKYNKIEEITKTMQNMLENYERERKEMTQVFLLSIQVLTEVKTSQGVVLQNQRDIFSRLNQKAFCVLDQKKEKVQ